MNQNVADQKDSFQLLERMVRLSVTIDMVCQVKYDVLWIEKLDISLRLTLSKASTILALPACTVMSDNAPGGPDWSAPVETSNETGVNLTIVTTTSHTSRRYHVTLLLMLVVMKKKTLSLRELLWGHFCSVARRGPWLFQCSVSWRR